MPKNREEIDNEYEYEAYVMPNRYHSNLESMFNIYLGVHNLSNLQSTQEQSRVVQESLRQFCKGTA